MPPSSCCTLEASSSVPVLSLLSHALLHDGVRGLLAVWPRHQADLLVVTCACQQGMGRCHPCWIVGEMKAARAACVDLAEGAATVRAPFGWEDGPLVTAMRRGDMILIDELNLADDAVIERLNRCGKNTHHTRFTRVLACNLLAIPCHFRQMERWWVTGSRVVQTWSFHPLP